MICRTCGADSKVLDSRQQPTSNIRWRRRECKCGRFTTYEIREDAIDREIVVTTKLQVGLKDGGIVTHDETDLKFLCGCGNEARYMVDGHGSPRLCGLCDIEKNDGKGIRV